jgi:hypothetical protein
VRGGKSLLDISRTISSVKCNFLISWDDLTIGYHETSADNMENQSDFDEPGGVNWQLLVEFRRLRIILDKKEFVNPEMKHVENAGEGIQNGHTR